ncbi:Ribophorin I [Tilletiaria anomala UBC 951]|uniref:Dolichyl-diphosphooligosaccharide--protein glycosyltransferase subunit 1 n=1 Tax=Tilletiaria anomala (strain ATCC 24038 / CBS 436.72 / UBC 951) TaxID=1037660 RepID=A0A066V789_TILAU|nr:Ribophorin I [Tilletiaria anomala UBC 951]KDN37321.1 Ribophorin I [Tilletiaria anomala UBC 951]
MPRITFVPGLLLLVGLNAAGCLAAVPNANDWHLTNVVKNLELHGSVSQAITTYTVKRGSGSSEPFFVAFSAAEYEKLAFADAIVDGQGKTPTALPLQDEGLDPEDPTTHLASLNLPESAAEVTVSVRCAYNHLVEALPKVIAQTDPVLLIWKGDVGLRTPYVADKGRVKVITPIQNVPNYTPKDETATKSGNKITFGPYENIQPYRSASIKQGSVHYEHPVPVTSVVTFDRVAEVSHWGDNIAIEDRIWLRNDGPALKGHFSRIDYQMAQFKQKGQASTLIRFRVHLPAGAKDAYFIDQIGNVSTSRFYPAPPAPHLIATPSNLLGERRSSALDLQPRYPILGGWNYTFSIGWNQKLSTGGWAKRLGAGTYSVSVPFLTPVGDATALDDVKTTIVLPEGATDIKTFLPFAVDSLTQQKYVTYLDTVGRPSLVLEKARCSEKHSQLVYVQYRLSPTAHLRKPLAVSTVALGLFMLAGALRRFDPKIKAQ